MRSALSFSLSWIHRQYKFLTNHEPFSTIGNTVNDIPFAIGRHSSATGITKSIMKGDKGRRRLFYCFCIHVPHMLYINTLTFKFNIALQRFK